MAEHSFLAHTRRHCLTLHGHLDCYVPKFKARHNVEPSGGDTNLRNIGAPGRGLSNDVQLREATVLPQVAGVHKIRKIKGQERSQVLLKPNPIQPNLPYHLTLSTNKQNQTLSLTLVVSTQSITLKDSRD